MNRLTKIGIVSFYLIAGPVYAASIDFPAVKLPGVTIPPVSIEIPTLSTQAPSKAESFRSRLQEQQKTLQSHGEKISGLVTRLKGMSNSTVDGRIAEVRSLRDALVQLGTQLQPDAPLTQGIDQYQTWISAQIARVNSQRSTLGPEFVQELVTRYQENQKEVTRAREALGNHAIAIDHTLKDLTTAEMRAAELLMADDAGAATKELVSVLDGIGKTIEDIRSNLNKLFAESVSVRQPPAAASQPVLPAPVQPGKVIYYRR